MCPAFLPVRFPADCRLSCVGFPFYRTNALSFQQDSGSASGCGPTSTRRAAPGKQTAVFAGGCFWGTQSVFERVKGVVDTTVGYAGGSADTATYDQVTTETTGHAESVKVVYDPAKITYGQLLRIFFSVAHDPTQLNRQGPDVGTSYRSAIFYANENQRRIAAGLYRAARRGPCLRRQDRYPGYAAQGLLRRRRLPPALRRPEPRQPLHPGLRPAQDPGAQSAVSRAL